MTNELDMMETTIRALTALADETGYRVIDLIMDLDCECGEPEIMDRTRKIIENGLGRTMTDSVIDDLCEYIDSDAGDAANE
jgi:hypothetical protein